MAQKSASQPSALDRLRARMPDGPPYCLLALDYETVEALMLGVVTSRAFVEAERVWRAAQPLQGGK